MRLKLEPYLDQRGYEAAVWRLVGTPDVPEDALRFAAWYFAGRGQMDALDELLGGRDVESSWYHTYSGLASAYAGEWTKAAQSFDAAYLSNPSWRTSLNRALSMIASGSPGSGAEALADAGAATRLLGPPADSSPLFVAVARAAADTTIAYDAVTTALELDPTNTEALLIRNQLESGSGY